MSTSSLYKSKHIAYNKNMEENKKNNKFTSLADLIPQIKPKKVTTTQWQGLALRIIQELNVPANKKSSVFRVCKTNSLNYIERCLIDTKELCTGTNKWAYFFKVVNNAKKEQAGDTQTIKQKQINFEKYKLNNFNKKRNYTKHEI